MATPPYENITGIYTIDDKHQAISRADYSGSARPGQIVIDTADYSMWVGTNTGSLVAAGGGGGGGSVTPPAGANTQVQFNNAGAFGGSVGLTFNSTTGILSAPKFSGNGANLSALPAANIVGTVANATYATSAGSANSVVGANVVGAVTFATTANAVAIANVTGAGNIAVLNLNGDGTKVLAGNGDWVTSSGGGSAPVGPTGSLQYVGADGALAGTGDMIYEPDWQQLTVGPRVDDGNGNSELVGTVAAGYIYADKVMGGKMMYSATYVEGGAYVEDDGTGTNTSIVDLNKACYFKMDVSVPVTLTLVSYSIEGPFVSRFTLEINGGSAGVTWWPGAKWSGGTAPVLSSGVDIIEFITDNGGSSTVGYVLASDVA